MSDEFMNGGGGEPENTNERPQDYGAPENVSETAQTYSGPQYDPNNLGKPDYSQMDYNQNPNQNGYGQPNYNQNGYNQNGYNQNGYNQQPYNQAPYGQPYQPGMATKSDTTGFGIASLVLGIISIFTFFCCINYVLAIIAIILGIVQIVKSSRKGLAIGGIVTAIISIVGATIFWVLVSSVNLDSMDPDSIRNYMDEYLQEYNMEQDNDAF